MGPVHFINGGKKTYNSLMGRESPFHHAFLIKEIQPQEA